MPTINEMRKEIAKCYTSSAWKNRVHFMEDRQVAAIYHRFLRTDKFNRAAEEQADKKKKKKKEQNHQMTLGEYFGRDIFPI